MPRSSFTVAGQVAGMVPSGSWIFFRGTSSSCSRRREFSRRASLCEVSEPLEREDRGTYVLCSWICFSRRVFLRVATSRWILTPASSSRYRSVSFATISSTIASNRSLTARPVSTVPHSSDAVHAPIFSSVCGISFSKASSRTT